jgi:hypothetical protein
MNEIFILVVAVCGLSAVIQAAILAPSPSAAVSAAARSRMEKHKPKKGLPRAKASQHPPVGGRTSPARTYRAAAWLE